MRGAPAVPTERPPQREDIRGEPAEVTAGDKEGRDTPKSERGREEDEKRFGPMGREGKNWLREKIGLEKIGLEGDPMGRGEYFGVGGVWGDDGGEVQGET